ncbi:chloride channel protein [Arenicella sp.]|nr:chloride channel protein [Arenicella sp.]
MTPAKLILFISSGYDRFREAQQVRMSSNFEGLPLLAILGLVCGLVSGGLIILFRMTMESGAGLILPNGDLEGFESLSKEARFFLCVGGGLLVGLLLQSLRDKSRNVGVVHVLERLDYHQGNLPIKNAVLQFVAATISLISGHSVGREGPSVHLGATGGSVLGRILQVPNNSVRILVGCGVAAAISAAFNTPLAGVIFAMEVVIMEYTVIGFTPVIISAVSATTLTRILLGDDQAITAPIYELNYIFEIPLVALMGAMIGCISAAFIQMTMFTSSLFIQQAIWIRTLLAGVITGLIAMLIPEVMGTGYDTLNHVLFAQIGLAGVILLTIAKFLATSTAIGLGIPAGLIGPTLFIGAVSGSTFGLFAADFDPRLTDAGFYAVLGMAAMMAATLQAPLAALIYLLELSSNQAVILPGMTAVITASLVTRVVFGKSSIYRHLMLARGLDYRNTPMSKALRRIGVASVMQRDVVQHTRLISKLEAENILKQEPRWVLLNNEEKRNTSLLPATDLARHLNELDPNHEDDQEHRFDLLTIPAKRLDTVAIPIIATLQEAHEIMHSNDCEILYVTGAHGRAKKRIYGIITREHIDSSYQF